VSPAEATPCDPRGELRQHLRDGALVWQLRCPECGHWGDIDDDQLHGRVSCDHADCGVKRGESVCSCTFHQTRDWFNTAVRV